MSYITDLEQAAEEALLASAQATTSSQIFYDVANGDASSVVSTDNGEVDTVAKVISTLYADIRAGVLESPFEELIATEDQQDFTLTTITTSGMALYIEGAREFDYTISSLNTFSLSEGLPADSRLWVTSNEVVGTESSSAAASAASALLSANNAADSEAAAGLYERNAEEAAESAADAQSRTESAAAVASASANFKGNWEDLSGALEVPASVYRNGTYWNLLEDVADVGGEDPLTSNAWASIEDYVAWQGISADTALTARRYYAVDFSSGPLTLTLPFTPVKDDFVEWYKSAGESLGSVIERNGSTIMGLAEDLEIDFEANSLYLIYSGSDWRIVR